MVFGHSILRGQLAQLKKAPPPHPTPSKHQASVSEEKMHGCKGSWWFGLAWGFQALVLAVCTNHGAANPNPLTNRPGSPPPRPKPQQSRQQQRCVPGARLPKWALCGFGRFGHTADARNPFRTKETRPNHCLLHICRGIIIPGFLRWCRNSSTHSITKKHATIPCWCCAWNDP